jgi:hypothetical protein
LSDARDGEWTRLQLIRMDERFHREARAPEAPATDGPDRVAVDRLR